MNEERTDRWDWWATAGAAALLLYAAGGVLPGAATILAVGAAVALLALPLWSRSRERQHR